MNFNNLKPGDRVRVNHPHRDANCGMVLAVEQDTITVETDWPKQALRLPETFVEPLSCDWYATVAMHGGKP